jgi:dynein light chain 1
MPASSLKNCLKKWEEVYEQKCGEAVEVKLIGVFPPIERMDNSLTKLVMCEKLSLSTNMISMINNLQNMKSLKILSLGRNLVKSLAGIEAVADTLEELWISYNRIEKLTPLTKMIKLKTLFMAHNFVYQWDQFSQLQELPCLKDLVFLGNPLEEELSEVRIIVKDELISNDDCKGEDLHTKGYQCLQAIGQAGWASCY